MSFGNPDAPNVKSTYFLDSNSVVTASDDIIMKWDLRDPSQPYQRCEITDLKYL